MIVSAMMALNLNASAIFGPKSALKAESKILPAFSCLHLVPDAGRYLPVVIYLSEG
jgi:hypothetical protein